MITEEKISEEKEGKRMKSKYENCLKENEIEKKTKWRGNLMKKSLKPERMAIKLWK